MIVSTIPKSELAYLYGVARFKVNDIAELYGKTRQTVWESLKRYGIAKRDVWVSFTCDLCKGPGKAREKVFLKSELHFCCHSCYMDYLRNDQYIQSRTGQRIAHGVLLEIAKKKGLSLPEKFVAHHEDGNDMNNEPSNLTPFKNHSDHLKHHHQLRRERLAQCQAM